MFHLQAEALPRLCDVRRVLLEEQAQCLQELSREKKGAPGPETASGRRPPLSPGALCKWILSSLRGGKPVPGTRWAVRGGFSFVHPISCRVGYMVFTDSEGSTLMSPFSGNSQCILTICFFTHSISR